MGKRKKKNKAKNHASLPQEKHQHISNIENLIIYGLIFSVFFIFSLSVNNHFALPKLIPIALLTSFLLGTVFYKAHIKEINLEIPLKILIPLLCLLLWWSVGTSQAINLQTALMGQVGRYNGMYTHLLMVILFFVMAHLQLTHAQLKILKRVLYISTVLLCVHAISQYFDHDLILNAKQTRPLATIGNPVALGIILIMIFPFALIDVVNKDASHNKLLSIGLLLTILATLFITGSRGPWLGLITSLIVLNNFYWQAIIKNKKIVINLFLVIILIMAPVLYFLFDWNSLLQRLSLDNSIKQRLMYFSTAFDIIKDNPVFGTGFESFRLVYPEYRPIEDVLIAGRDTTPTMVHNDYLQFALDNGILALLFFIAFVSSALFLIYKSIKENNKYRPFLIAVIASITGYLTQSLSGWLETPSFFLFWFMLGLGVAVALSNREVEPKPGVRVAHQLFAIAGILFLLFYVTQLNQFYNYEKTARKMFGYHLGGSAKTVDEYIRTLNRIAPNEAFYQDKIGGIYLDRLARGKSDNNYNYRQAHKHFMQAQTLNPYNVYIRLNLMIADSIALSKGVIEVPSEITLTNINEVEKRDPNNPTVYETRAKLYRAMREPVKQALDLVKVKQLLKKS